VNIEGGSIYTSSDNDTLKDGDDKAPGEIDGMPTPEVDDLNMEDCNEPLWEDAEEGEDETGDGDDNPVEEEDTDTSWSNLHSDEVQAMLNASSENTEQYEIRKHLWSNVNLRLKVICRFSGSKLTIDANDAQVDVHH